MKIITAYSHKGGTGKTTALLLLASAIDARGSSCLLVDCDPHQSFKGYQQYAPHEWPSSMDVVYYNYETTDIEVIENLLLDADEASKYDYCLINLSGVDHPFNRKVIRYAEVTLIPFAPAALDLMEIPGALDAIRKLDDAGEVGEARLVFTKMKTRMSVAQTDYHATAINDFPTLETQIKETATMADLVMKGLLARSALALDTSSALEAKRLRETLENGTALLSELDTVIAEIEA